MDVSLLIRQRLEELNLGQKDLAGALEVTESYVSQLLAGKKAPSPTRTRIYQKISEYLRLPKGELVRLAEVQRGQELKRKARVLPRALFQEGRELVLRKCEPRSRAAIARIFEREPFGELERLVTQKILAVSQDVTRDCLGREDLMQAIAESIGCDYSSLRDEALAFVDADIMHVTPEACALWIDPAVESWDVDLRTFSLEIVLSRTAAGETRRFEFEEKRDRAPFSMEPGFEQFLADKSMSGDATSEEIRFLTRLTFEERRPSALYYYRELQNLRDPLHFPSLSSGKSTPKSSPDS